MDDDDLKRKRPRPRRDNAAGLSEEMPSWEQAGERPGTSAEAAERRAPAHAGRPTDEQVRQTEALYEDDPAWWLDRAAQCARRHKEEEFERCRAHLWEVWRAQIGAEFAARCRSSQVRLRP